MAEKAEKKKEEGHEEGGGGKKAPIWTKLPVLLGGVMVIEAVALFGVFKVMGAGKPASATAAVELKTEEGGHGEEEAGAGEKPAEGAKHGEEAKAEGGGHGESGGGAAGGHGAASAPVKKGAIEEAEVTTFRAPNVKSGRRQIYDVAIYASVKSENKAKLEGIIKGRKAAIEDRVRTIIAQSDPDKLGGGTEPGLETLRRQVKYQIEEITGEGLIIEILIPKCIAYRGE